MNKLKIFFLSIILGFSGLLFAKTPEIQNPIENTMIQNNINLSAKRAIEVPSATNNIVLIEKITSVNISQIHEPITEGSTRAMTISYLPAEANEPIRVAAYKNDDDSTSSNAIVISSLEFKDGQLIGTISGTNAGECKLKFFGLDGREINTEGVSAEDIHVSVKPYETVSDIINNVMSSSTVIIFIVSIAATVVARTGIKIFRFGVNYKSNFATVEQQQNFENSMRNEMRNSKSEIQDNLLKICLREINRETKPVKELQEIAENMKTDRQILDVKLDAIDEKYNEIKHTTESYNRLEAKVNRMQYGDDTKEIRRQGK